MESDIADKYEIIAVLFFCVNINHHHQTFWKEEHISSMCVVYVYGGGAIAGFHLI